MTQAANLAKGTGTAANQVVALDGSGKLPAVDGSQLLNLATGGLIRAPRLLTSGTTYTTPSNCTALFVELVGGGGAGAGYLSGAAGGGGGGGCYLARYFSVTPNTVCSYTIGAGGTGYGAGAGGATTFTTSTSSATAGGGSGGSTTSPGAGGTGTGGSGTTMNVPGQDGEGGAYISSTYISGTGGSSFFGYGGQSVWASGTRSGYDGTGYGAGGGGAIGGGGVGGNGTDGVIRIWEYS